MPASLGPAEFCWEPILTWPIKAIRVSVGCLAHAVDLDFVHTGRNVSVAIPSDVAMDMDSEIEALQIGFVPVKSLTIHVKSDEQDLQIDLVMCMHCGGDTPVLIKAPNSTMQPLKFMEFSMEALI